MSERDKGRKRKERISWQSWTMENKEKNAKKKEKKGELFASSLILGRDIHDTIGINVKANLNLRHTLRSRRNANKVEAAQDLVIGSHGSVSLKNLNLDLCLVVSSGGEGLGLLGRDGGVGHDELGHHATKSLDSQRERSDIEQENTGVRTGEDTTLNGGTDGLGVRERGGREKE